ncbi:LPXTG cell wall anchor domain-containing protein [Staphylococcus americanisciuri]|uniref:LPXTG cell wall anchor domain-containing protein n=1 Tax=Staphylococcus americanisciuri TaxID=2973940 RepID=A0ABT2F192_9STAP|nr:LPXTG cell wall anchor domain-containing protein [Staphylococcus americanisciuri]MCS4486122.1 LPXTG cell wall anchor domain-containing protein [Staphylococcus americanisciuri]
MFKKTIAVSLLATATFAGIASNTFADNFDPLSNLPTDANGACIIESEDELQTDNIANTQLPSSTQNDTTTVQGVPFDHCNGFVFKTTPKKWSMNPPTDFTDSNSPQNSATNHVVPKTPVQTPAQQVTPATDNNISQQEPTQSPSSSHTKLKELPNTGTDTQTSPLAIFGFILLGGALLAYRPVTSLSKSK